LGGTTFTRLHLSAGDWHGTAVAGMIAAAAGNGLGGTGVAPGARISSLNFLEQVQFQPDATVLAALAWGGAHAIAHNSWIYAPHFGPGQSLADPAGWSSAVATVYAQTAATGRGGLGTITVHAAGDGAANANGEGLLASRHVIAVAATDAGGNATGASNWGANILVAAPAGAVTTDRSGSQGRNAAGSNDGDPLPSTSYASVFGGTDAASALVSGVAALVLQANPGLGWREVQAILAISARHTGSP